MKTFTSKQVTTVGAGRWNAGANLYLNVTPNGSRSWVARVSWNKRVREIGIGSVNVCSLAEARAKVLDIKRDIARNIDPTRQRETIPTFKECVDQWLAAKKAEWTTKHYAGTKASLEHHASALFKLPVNEVDVNAILKTLAPIWGTDQVRRVRNRIERVLSYAKAKGYRDGDNPASWKDGLEHTLAKRDPLKKRHFAAMPWPDVPAFMRALRADSSVTARALEFTILCAARTGETFGATFDEFDLNAGTWTLAPARTKQRRQHVVMLSDRAIEIVRGLYEVRRCEYVFPGRRRRSNMSGTVMRCLMKKLGAGQFNVHAFRSSFRDFVFEATEFQGDVAEAALGHIGSNLVERAYKRGSAMSKRKLLAQAWCDFCNSPADNVVRLHA